MGKWAEDMQGELGIQSYLKMSTVRQKHFKSSLPSTIIIPRGGTWSGGQLWEVGIFLLGAVT